MQNITMGGGGAEAAEPIIPTLSLCYTPLIIRITIPFTGEGLARADEQLMQNNTVSASSTGTVQ